MRKLASACYALPVRIAFDKPKLVTAGLKRLFG
jgi:hypothetical protein